MWRRFQRQVWTFFRITTLVLQVSRIVVLREPLRPRMGAHVTRYVVANGGAFKDTSTPSP